MEKRIGILFWGLTAFCLLLFASISILRGGLLDLAQAIVLLAPFIFIVFFRCRMYWHLLIPVFLVTGQMRIPVYGLQQMTLSLVLLMSATALLILDQAFHLSKKERTFKWEDGLVLGLALILSGRIIYDRPGFVGLGMAEGGFMQAFTMVMASWFYFTAQRVAFSAKFTRKQLQWATYGVCLVGIYNIIIGDRTQFFWRPLGGAAFWMLCAMLLALFITSTHDQRKTLWVYMTSILFMVGAILSGYRSRVFFYFTQLGAVSWFARRVRKNLLIVGVAGAAGLFAVVSVSGEVPDLMRRFVSLFADVEVSTTFVGGAYGRTDEFRAEMARLAWMEMRESPWIGSGFGLDVSEAIGVLMTDQRATFTLLAMSRSYHNSVLMLAVRAGIPAALLFCIVSIVIPIKFARKIFYCEESDFRTWGIAIFAFWSANMFMLQVNGGPSEYFACMVLNGYMMGMLKNQSLTLTKE